MPSFRTFRPLVAIAVAASVCSPLGCGSQTSERAQGRRTGSVELGLDLPNGETIDEILLSLTCGDLSQDHVVDVSGGDVVAAFGGLTPGPCSVRLSSHAAGGRDCAGEASFEVEGGETTEVDVTLTCQGDQNSLSGDVKVRSELSLHACTQDRIKKISVAPSNVPTGESTVVEVELHAGAAVGGTSFVFEARNDATHTGEGILSAASGCSATADACRSFTCTGVGDNPTADPLTSLPVGSVFVNVTVEDDECFDTEEIWVDCVESASCGNGTLEGIEECDDGNTDVDDGCSDECRFEVCGDGITQTVEECDDGNSADDDGCSALCVLESCGDGILHSGEECDGTAGVGEHQECDESCMLVDLPYCGNGIVDQSSEECDGADGLTDPVESCTEDCVIIAPWLDQFGTSAADTGEAVGCDTSGDVFVAGSTEGNLGGTGSSGGSDAYLAKRAGLDGSLLWTRQFGTSVYDVALSLAVDGAGDVLVAGDTDGDLSGAGAGGRDAYVVKLSGVDGSNLWTRQFGTSAGEQTTSVAVDPQGDVLVAGRTFGNLGGTGNAGAYDGYACKLSGVDGSVIWTVQFGTGALDDAFSIASDSNGNAVVAGRTQGAMAGGSNAGSYDAFVLRLAAADGQVLWIRQFGTAALDDATSVTVDAADDVLVAGRTNGNLGGGSLGTSDGFVRKLASADGSEIWTNQFGTSTFDLVNAVSEGGIVAASGRTLGDLGGDGNAGSYDAIIVRIDGASGSLIGVDQFGTAALDDAKAVKVVSPTSLLVAGSTSGNLDGEGAAGASDAFVGKLFY